MAAALETQRANPLQSVEIIGVVMGHLIHYFPRPIGSTAAPIMSCNAYALQVVIPPHSSIDSGAMLIVGERGNTKAKKKSQMSFSEEGFYINRSGNIGHIAWYSTPPDDTDRVRWIRLP